MIKKISVFAAAALFCIGLSSCGKTKTCAAYSKADIEKTAETEV